MENILLIFGGNSFEHDISILTALIVKNQYRYGKYNILPVYIDHNNEWFFYGGKEKLMSSHFSNFDRTHNSNGFVKCYLKTGQKALFYKKGLLEKRLEVSAALNCCHGGIGESGNLTSMLEGSNIPISSGSHTALGILMDKVISKYVFDGLGLPNLPYFKISKASFTNNKQRYLNKANKLGFPIILKPATLGSSIGISIIKSPEEFYEKVENSFVFEDNILAEKAILEGMTEYNIACMRVKDKVIVSGIDKPLKSDEILSFKDKYIGDDESVISKNSTKKIKGKSSKMSGGSYMSQNINFPYNVDEKLQKQLEQIAVEVYTKLYMYGPVRIDFIACGEENVYLNEVNTIPGSLGYYFFVPSYFKDMTNYIDEIINTSIYLFNKQQKIKKEFITNLF